jgi:hypothetical protein
VPVRVTCDVRSGSAGAAFRPRSVGFRMLRQAARPVSPRDRARMTSLVAERLPRPSDFELAASLWESPVRGPRCDLESGP